MFPSPSKVLKEGNPNHLDEEIPEGNLLQENGVLKIWGIHRTEPAFPPMLFIASGLRWIQIVRHPS